MKKQVCKFFLIVLGIYSFTGHTLETEFGSHGYLRASKGVASDGHTHKCFKAPGIKVKYRLGNECEFMSEIAGYAILSDDTDGSLVRLQGMLLFLGQDNRTLEHHSTPELFMEMDKLWSRMPKAKLWVGRHYYHRSDIHINDYFFFRHER